MKSEQLKSDCEIIASINPYCRELSRQYRRMAVALDEIRDRSEHNGWVFTCKQCHKALKRFEDGGK